jgi:hypothetical protein
MDPQTKIYFVAREISGKEDSPSSQSFSALEAYQRLVKSS